MQFKFVKHQLALLSKFVNGSFKRMLETGLKGKRKGENVENPETAILLTAASG